MVWDFAEGHPVRNCLCELTWSAGWIAKALKDSQLWWSRAPSRRLCASA